MGVLISTCTHMTVDTSGGQVSGWRLPVTYWRVEVGGVFAHREEDASFSSIIFEFGTLSFRMNCTVSRDSEGSLSNSNISIGHVANAGFRATCERFLANLVDLHISTLRQTVSRFTFVARCPWTILDCCEKVGSYVQQLANSELEEGRKICESDSRLRGCAFASLTICHLYYAQIANWALLFMGPNTLGQQTSGRVRLGLNQGLRYNSQFIHFGVLTRHYIATCHFVIRRAYY